MDALIAWDATSEASGVARNLSAALIEIVAQARTAIRRDPSAADHWLNRFEHILHEAAPAADAARPGIPRAGGLAPWQVIRAKRHIEANLEKRLNTPDLAALVGLSENHFAKAFRISVGCPPHAYIVQRRVLHAKILIVETDLPLAQIALDSGFADQAHLCRLFRRFFDATPSACRRLMCAPAFEERPAAA